MKIEIFKVKDILEGKTRNILGIKESNLLPDSPPSFSATLGIDPEGTIVMQTHEPSDFSGGLVSSITFYYTKNPRINKK